MCEKMPLAENIMLHIHPSTTQFTINKTIKEVAIVHKQFPSGRKQDLYMAISIFFRKLFLLLNEVL